jgi:hypothetical protein
LAKAVGGSENGCENIRVTHTIDLCSVPLAALGFSLTDTSNS